MVSRTSLTVPGSRHRRLVGAGLERCILCDGTAIRREGRRVKKLEIIQLWYCRDCDRVFTAQRMKGRTYPLKVVLEALMCYYRGESREQTSSRMRERFGMAVPSRTLSTWLAEYRDLNTYARLRAQRAALYRPNRLILDCKPGARREKPVSQLMVYALAHGERPFFPCRLHVRRIRFWEIVIAHWRHPNPAYRVPLQISIVLGTLGVVLGALGAALGFLSLR